MNTNLVFSQDTPLRLLDGSDDIRLDGKTGNYIVRGNVRFVKDDTKMFCDSAFYNKDESTVRAYGNVHINKQDTINLYCDSLFYDLDTEFAKLWGNVRVRDNDYKLVTDSLDFYNDENKAVYRAGGVITNMLSPERLESDVGYIYTESKNFFFRSNVVYTDEKYKITTDTLKYNSASKKAFFFGPTNIYSEDGDMYCEKGWYHTGDEEGVFQQNAFIDREKEYISGDSLYYNGLAGLSIGKGNVVIRDTANRIEFNGDFARSDENEHFAFITGHALAKRFEDEEDTLFIHADTLYNYLDTLNEPKLMLGYYGVKLFKSDMQGVCDSLSYDRVSGEMNLYVDPILWAKNAQLTGDTISVYEKDGDIERAFLRLDALVVTEVDSSNYYNQVAGKTITAYFDSSEIRKVDIEGNAQTIYFMEDEDEEDSVIVVTRSGMNRIMASNFSLYFEGGDISTAVYRNSPDGKMYPMDKIVDKDKEVETFQWDNTRRPISWQTMILTPEEFEIWKIHQKEKKKLLALEPLVFEKNLKPERVIRSKNWMNKYIKTNTDYLFNLVYEDSLASEIDSLNLAYSEFLSENSDSLEIVSDSLSVLSDSTDTIVDVLEEIEINPTSMRKVNDWGNALNHFTSVLNNYQACILNEVKLEGVFVLKNIDSLSLLTSEKYLFDSTFQEKIEFNLDSISEKGKRYSDIILDEFPNFKQQQRKIKTFDKRKDSIENAIAELLPKEEPEALNFFTITDSTNILNNIIDKTIDSLISLKDKTEMLDKNDTEELDSTQLAENKIIADSLQQLLFTLKRPTLSEKQKAAIKIAKYFDFNRMISVKNDTLSSDSIPTNVLNTDTLDSDSLVSDLLVADSLVRDSIINNLPPERPLSTKEVIWEDESINNQNIFKVYMMLEAIKVDALNIYREILLQEVLRIRRERKRIVKSLG